MTMLAITWVVGKAINGAAQGIASAVAKETFQAFLKGDQNRWKFLNAQVDALNEMISSLAQMVIAGQAACSEPGNRERVALAVSSAEASADLWSIKQHFAGLDFQPVITPIVARGTEIAAALAWYWRYGLRMLNAKPDDMSADEWEAQKADIQRMMTRIIALAESQGLEMARLSQQVAEYLCKYMPDKGPIAALRKTFTDISQAVIRDSGATPVKRLEED